jgi:hypothetical protein
VAMCVLKMVAITALCYKAFRPFAKIVLNNQFVLAARSKTNPSTPTTSHTIKSKAPGKAAAATPATPTEVVSFRDHHDDVAAAAVVSPIHHDVPIVVESPVEKEKKMVLPPIEHALAVAVAPVVPAVLPEIRRARLSLHTAHLQSPSRSGAEAIALTVNAATASVDDAVYSTGEGATMSQETPHMTDSDVTYGTIGEHAEQL